MPHLRKRQCPPTIYDSNSSSTSVEDIKIESTSNEIDQPSTSAAAIERETSAEKRRLTQETRRAAQTKKQRNAERMRRNRDNAQEKESQERIKKQSQINSNALQEETRRQGEYRTSKKRKSNETAKAIQKSVRGLLIFFCFIFFQSASVLRKLAWILSYCNNTRRVSTSIACSAKITVEIFF